MEKWGKGFVISRFGLSTQVPVKVTPDSLWSGLSGVELYQAAFSQAAIFRDFDFSHLFPSPPLDYGLRDFHPKILSEIPCITGHPLSFRLRSCHLQQMSAAARLENLDEFLVLLNVGKQVSVE